MIDYNGKCATCIYFVQNEDGRAGMCKALSRKIGSHSYPYTVNFSKVGCVRYARDSNRVCECGVYRERDYNFCPACGRTLRTGDLRRRNDEPTRDTVLDML